MDEIRIEDLHPSYQMLADIVGIDNAIRIGARLGGSPLYIPKLDSALLKIRNRKITEEFNGHNYFYLARKHNLTERQIREIVARGRTEAKTRATDGAKTGI